MKKILLIGMAVLLISVPAKAFFGGKYLKSESKLDASSEMEGKPLFSSVVPENFDVSKEVKTGDVSITPSGRVKFNNILFSERDLAYTAIEELDEVNPPKDEYGLLDAVLFSLNHTLDGSKSLNNKSLPEYVNITNEEQAKNFGKAVSELTEYISKTYEGIKGCKGAKCFTTFNDWVEDADEIWRSVLSHTAGDPNIIAERVKQYIKENPVK